MHLLWLQTTGIASYLKASFAPWEHNLLRIQSENESSLLNQRNRTHEMLLPSDIQNEILDKL